MLTEKIAKDCLRSIRLTNFLASSRVVDGEKGTFFETKVQFREKGPALESFISLLNVNNIKYDTILSNPLRTVIHIPKLPLKKVDGVVGRKKHTFAYIPKPDEQVELILKVLTNRQADFKLNSLSYNEFQGVIDYIEYNMANSSTTA